MGTQGEIYNLLGLVVPAELVQRDKFYKINGKLVAANEDVLHHDSDLMNGIHSCYPNKNLRLSIRILGHTTSMGSKHFEGEALVGYAIANESYLGRATRLPTSSEIDSFRPLVVRDIKSHLDLIVDPAELRLHLLMDWIQGF